MMILEVFLAFLLPVDCACAHLRVGEGSSQGGATSLQTPSMSRGSSQSVSLAALSPLWRQLL